MYELNNYTETLVRQALQEYRRNYVLTCICERCQIDIMTLALNSLPPRYFASVRGELFSKIESTSVEDQGRIMTEVARAVQIVNARPTHK